MLSLAEIISRKKANYTVSYKLTAGLNGKSAIPGSLEESIESPEDFFKLNEIQSSLPTRNQSLLNPINIYAKAQLKERLPSNTKVTKVLADAMRKKITCIINNQSYKKMIKPIKEEFKEILDSDIMTKYEKVNEIITNKNFSEIYKAKRALSLGLTCEDRQEILLNKYDMAQNKYKKALNKSCSAIGRDPNDSVILRSNEVRERIGKTGAIKMAYAVKNWYMELRKSEKLNDIRKHLVPIGGSVNTLWMNMIDTNKPQTIIRTPYFLKGFPSLKDKQPNIDTLMVLTKYK